MIRSAQIGKFFYLRPSDKTEHYRIEGTLPYGLTFDKDFGTLSGKPKEKGTYEIHINRFHEKFSFWICVKKRKERNRCPLIFKSITASGTNSIEDNASYAELHVFFKGQVTDIIRSSEVTIHIQCIPDGSNIISDKFHPSTGTTLIIKTTFVYSSKTGPFDGIVTVKTGTCHLVIPFIIIFTN